RGHADREVDLVFAGNMAVRRSALERIGPFAESLGLYAAGEEARRIAAASSGSAPVAGFFGEEAGWRDRYRAGGGRPLCVAAAGCSTSASRSPPRRPCAGACDPAAG